MSNEVYEVTVGASTVVVEASTKAKAVKHALKEKVSARRMSGSEVADFISNGGNPEAADESESAES